MRVEQIDEIKSLEIDVLNGQIKVNGEPVEALRVIEVHYGKLVPNCLSICLKGAGICPESCATRSIEETFFDFQKS